jgi:hypothetical protein
MSAAGRRAGRLGDADLDLFAVGALPQNLGYVAVGYPLPGEEGYTCKYKSLATP